MKKILFLASLVIIPALCFAATEIGLDQVVGFIGPTHTNSKTVSTVTIAAPGGGLRNCLTDFSITTSSNATIRILDAGTTIYAIDLSTITGQVDRSLPFAEDWYGTNALCAGYNSSLSFTILNSTGSPAVYKLNYQGVIRGR